MQTERKPVSGEFSVSRSKVWMTAVRPRTLTIALAPVVVATALAWSDGAQVRWHVVLVILLCALLIQAGTNLHNDVADFERGTDDADRVGPLRVTSAGWVQAADVRRATWLAYCAALLLGVYLVSLGGWGIAAIGLASLAAGWSYSGGKRPLSHTAWGELVVFVFFGVLAVMGTYWLLADRLSFVSGVCGAILGLPAAAVLLVNNFRDRDSDCRAGRRTLAFQLGDRGAQRLYAALVLAPFACTLYLAVAGLPGTALSLVLLPYAWSLRSRLVRGISGASLNALLGATAKLELLLALTVAMGVLL